MMLPDNQIQLLIIAPPGRLRENLIAMASSVLAFPAIQIIDTCRMAVENFRKASPALILIDYREPDGDLMDHIKTLHKNNPGSLFIFLQINLGQNFSFTGCEFREVIYGDVSGEMLHRLIQEIEQSHANPPPLDTSSNWR